MRVLIAILMLTSASFWANKASSQYYTTYSKQCGSCGHEVSNDSRVGMRCPFCGVRWGYENETTKTDYSTASNYSSTPYYSSTPSSGYTMQEVNLRKSPSTKSSIKAVIPSATTVNIISSHGSWYYVSYSTSNGYYSEDMYGYVKKSLIN